MSTFHAYVHIPFCRVRCGYCDFNTYTATELRGVSQNSFAEIIKSEISLSKSIVGQRSLSSVFFGGGTPTQLPAADLIGLLGELENTFGLEPNAEVTTEANPDNVNFEYLEQLKAGGFTRVSFGMQSAENRVLQLLDRSHDAARMPLVVEWAKTAGLQVSVDLIYGTPTESLAEWQSSLKSAIALNPDHISAYSLIVEPGTAMFRKIKTAVLPPVDEDAQAEMYLLADQMLSEAGFQWYEVSNFSTGEATRSAHNLAYWNSQDWWGYGPGAHSHLAGKRWWNVKHPATYSAKLAEKLSPEDDSETLSESDKITEAVLLKIRIATGLDMDFVKSLSGYSAELIADFIREGLVEANLVFAGRLVLTLKGRLLADSLVRQLTA